MCFEEQGTKDTDGSVVDGGDTHIKKEGGETDEVTKYVERENDRIEVGDAHVMEEGKETDRVTEERENRIEGGDAHIMERGRD